MADPETGMPMDPAMGGMPPAPIGGADAIQSPEVPKDPTTQKNPSGGVI